MIHEKADAADLRMETRIAALQALLHMDQERAVPMLKKIITDDSPDNRELRSNAVMLACHEGGQEIRDLLLGLLKTETDADFLSEIILCLAHESSPEVLDQLLDLYKINKNPKVTEAVLMSVAHFDGKNESDKVFEFLSTIARDTNQNPEIRQHALMALSMHDQDKRVLGIFIELLNNDQDRDVQEICMMGLSRLNNSQADEALRAIITNGNLDEEFKSQALFAASHNGRTPLAFLREVYDNAKSEELKLQVCHILSRHDDQDGALDIMLGIVRSEKNLRIKQEMIFWMGHFDDPRAADFLIEILNEE